MIENNRYMVEAYFYGTNSKVSYHPFFCDLKVLSEDKAENIYNNILEAFYKSEEGKEFDGERLHFVITKL